MTAWSWAKCRSLRRFSAVACRRGANKLCCWARQYLGEGKRRKIRVKPGLGQWLWVILASRLFFSSDAYRRV